MASAAKTFAGTFKYHYQMHAPIGPNVSVADVTDSSAIIYGHVKNGYGVTRPQVADIDPVNVLLLRLAGLQPGEAKRQFRGTPPRLLRDAGDDCSEDSLLHASRAEHPTVA